MQINFKTTLYTSIWRVSDLEVSVNDGDGEIEGLLEQGEPQVDLDQPVNENGPHLGVDLRLLGQVGRVHLVLGLQQHTQYHSVIN